MADLDWILESQLKLQLPSLEGNPGPREPQQVVVLIRVRKNLEIQVCMGVIIAQGNLQIFGGADSNKTRVRDIL